MITSGAAAGRGGVVCVLSAPPAGGVELERAGGVGLGLLAVHCAATVLR